MTRSVKATIAGVVLLAGLGFWALRPSAPPPSVEEIAPAEKAAAVAFFRQALAASQERSAYTGRRKFLRLAANPRDREMNNNSFRLLRELRVTPEDRWRVVRHKKGGALEISFRDGSDDRIVVMLEERGGGLKFAGAMRI